MGARWSLVGWFGGCLLALATGCGSSEHDEGDGDAGRGGSAGTPAAGTGGDAGGSAAAAGLSASSGTGGGASGGTAGAARGGRGGGASGSGQAGGPPGTGGSSASGGASGGGAPSADCMAKTTNHASGTRLRASFLVTPDGARSWRGFHDIQRDEDCAFYLTTDGSTRCVPSSARAGNRYFTDAACTDEIYTFTFGTELCGAPEYISRVDTTACSTTSISIHEVGAEYTDTTSVYALSAEGACSATSTSATVYWRLGAEIPADSFVAATRVEVGTSRIRGVAYSAEDGTFQLTGWRDSLLDSTSHADLAEDGERRFLPQGVASINTTYADASCQTPLVTFQAACRNGKTPAFAREPAAAGACPAIGALHNVGPAFAGQTYTSASGCAALPADPDFGYAAVGDVIPPSSLTAVERFVNEEFPGRLKPIYMTTADGGCWFDSWYDSTLDTDCSFSMMSDGEVHCAPSAAARGTLTATYADAACSEPKRYILANDCDTKLLDRYYPGSATDSCAMTTGVTQLYQLGNAVPRESLPDLWLGSSCVATTLPEGYSYVEVGAPLSPDALVGGVLEVE